MNARTVGLLAATFTFTLCSTVRGAGVEPAPFEASPLTLLEAAGEDPGGPGPIQHLRREVAYRFEADGTLELRQYDLYRLRATKPDEQWSIVGARFASWRHERPVLEARVVTPDGGEHLFDPRTAKETPLRQDLPEAFSDDRMLHAPLPALGPGALVERRVTVREHSPFSRSGRFVLRSLAADGAPLARDRIVVDAPASLALRHRVIDARLEPKRTQAAGRVRLVFEREDVPASEELEPEIPPQDLRWPRLILSTARGWREVSQGYGALVAAALEAGGLGSKAKELTREATTREGKVAAILAWVRESVRDTGLELGASAIVPRSPEESAIRQYGDAKDLSAMLVALLRAAGIEAHLALLDASDGPDVPEDLPGLEAFDHVVVFVPGKPDLWIDPADRFAPAGELGPAAQGRRALVIAPETRGLRKTPEVTSADNVVRHAVDIELPPLGKGRYRRTSESRGPVSAPRRSFALGSTEEQLRRTFEKIAAKEHEAEGLARFDHSDPAALAQPYRYGLEIAGSSFGETTERTAVARGELHRLFEDLPQVLTEEMGPGKARTKPLWLRQPYRAELEVRVVPPPGYRLRELPPAVEHALGPARLVVRYAEEKGGTASMRATFDTGARRYTPEDVRAFRETFAELRVANLFFVNEGLTNLEEGRVKEAFAVIRGLCARDPKSGLYRSWLARALLAARAGELARREAAAAAALEPGRLEVVRTRGWVLLHDPVGRYLRPGMDRAGALEALKKARASAPEDRLTRALLLDALVHDDAGEFLGAKARAEEAAAVCREWRERTGDGSFDDTHAMVLWRAGRLDELAKRAPELAASKARDAVWVAVTAVRAGAAEALTLARGQLAESGRDAALNEAWLELLRTRRYAEASALLGAITGARGAAPDSNPHVAVIGRARRHEEVLAGGGDPVRGLVLRLMRAMMLEEGGEELGPIFEPALSQDELRNLARMLGQVRGAFSVAGVPPEVLVDLTEADLALRLEGEQGTARLYKAQFGLKPDAGFHLIVVPAAGGSGGKRSGAAKAGELRLHPASFSPGLLGGEALERLARGELEPARTLLRWAARLAKERGDPTGFLERWKRSESGGVPELRVAAAVLAAAEERGAARAAPVIEEAFAKAPEGRERDRLRFALATAFEGSRSFEKLEKLGAELLADPELREVGFAMRTRALQRGRKYSAIRQEAQRFLEQSPDEPHALAVLELAAANEGRFDLGIAAALRLAELNEEVAEHLNNAAWFGLFTGADAAAIERAQRANAMSGYKSPGQLDTLAALYAEAGRVNEALKTLESFLPQSPDADELSGSVWYTLGRLAEALELPEAAKAAYERVRPDEESPSNDVAPLARKRLKAMQAPSNRPNVPATSTAHPL